LLTFNRFARVILSWHLALRARCSDDWGPIITVALGDGAYSNANPAIVYDEDGNWRILLHYDTRNNPGSNNIGKNMQIWSDDEGLSWSEATEITYFFPSESQGCMPGPAIGIQNQRDGHPQKGRIYFNCHSGNGGGNHVLYYSDDNGDTWTVGEQLGDDFNECMIGFLPSRNESLIMNCRTSGDRGELFFDPDINVVGDAVYPDGLSDSGCMGSIIVRAGEDGNDDAVYMSNAVGPDRTHMTLKKSLDSGLTFDEGELIWEGPAAYR